MKNVVFILCWIGILCLHAQDSTQSKKVRKIWRGSTIAYSLSKFRDQGQSPLLYRGPEIFAYTFRERVRTKCNTRIDMSASFGMLKVRKNQTYYRTSIQSFKLELQYHWLFNLSDSTKKTKWQVGPLLGNSIDNHLYIFLGNNAYSYQYANYLGVSVAAQKQFSLLKRSWLLNWRGQLPVLAHVVRPNYIGMSPASTYEGSNISIFPILFTGNKIATVSTFFAIRSEFSLDLIRNNRNDLRLFYAWTLGFDKTQNDMIYAKHFIGIGKTLSKEKNKKKFKLSFKKKNKNISNPIVE